MFTAGPRDHLGVARVTTTICPAHLLDEDDGLALDFVDWWMLATKFDGFTGAAVETEWPYEGSQLCQPAAVVDAVALLRVEWAVLVKQHATSSRAPQTTKKG